MDRNNNGQFVKGHSLAGPGPKAQRLRAEIYRRTNEDDIGKVWETVIKKASDPSDRDSLRAADLALTRVLGRPINADMLEHIARLEERMDVVARLS